MKILAVGDFEGKFPKKFEDIIKKEKIDIVLANGDYCTFSLRKEFFEHVYANPFAPELWEIVGKKKYKEKVIYDHKKGEDVLKKLNKLPIPVLTVFGNNDYPLPDDVSDYKPNKENYWKWDWERIFFFAKLLKKYKNIGRIDYRYAKFKGFVFIGARGHSFPGHVKSKSYKKHRKKLDDLFNKFKKENKQRKVVFLSHNVPYQTKLDMITSKGADERARGKHYGSKLFRRIIDKYQPVVSVAGHVDEGMGKQKIGKTMAVNCGPAHDGKGAIIDIEDKGKVKVKFIK